METNCTYYEHEIRAVMHRIEEKVRANWMQEGGCFNDEISAAHLAHEMHMSVRNLQLMFKSFTGVPLHQYVGLRRLGYAQQLMRYRSLTLAEIADHLGFANPQALSNKFSKVFGNTPLEQATKPLPFQYQSGYLTIKSYPGRGDKYILGVPNAEVRIALEQIMPPPTLRTVGEL